MPSDAKKKQQQKKKEAAKARQSGKKTTQTGQREDDSIKEDSPTPGQDRSQNGTNGSIGLSEEGEICQLIYTVDFFFFLFLG